MDIFLPNYLINLKYFIDRIFRIPTNWYNRTFTL